MTEFLCQARRGDTLKEIELLCPAILAIGKTIGYDDQFSYVFHLHGFDRGGRVLINYLHRWRRCSGKDHFIARAILRFFFHLLEQITGQRIYRRTNLINQVTVLCLKAFARTLRTEAHRCVLLLLASARTFATDASIIVSHRHRR